MRSVLILAACAVLGACAATDPQLASSDPERMVCRNEKVTGQHRPERVCMTAAQRDRLRNATQDSLVNSGNERPQPYDGKTPSTAPN